MKLPPITKKQQDIVELIYRHRFLTRETIQILINHKEKRRSARYLKDLKDKDYLGWIYDPTNFITKASPAIYYLSLNGIRYLRSLDKYPSEELRKRYKESSRKQSFINNYLLLADCCLNLEAKNSDDLCYTCILQPDYLSEDSEHNFLDELKPDACFIKQDNDITTNYLFEIVPATTPRYKLKKRIKSYVSFLEESVWESETNEADPPIIQLAFDKQADLIYAKARVKYELTEIYDDEIPSEYIFRFTTQDQIKQARITGKIWQEFKGAS
jgi:hypothetical protein